MQKLHLLHLGGPGVASSLHLRGGLGAQKDAKGAKFSGSTFNTDYGDGADGDHVRQVGPGWNRHGPAGTRFGPGKTRHGPGSDPVGNVVVTTRTRQTRQNRLIFFVSRGRTG
jgi:hypothetical protein